jgi:hypothetical protein
MARKLGLAQLRHYEVLRSSPEDVPTEFHSFGGCTPRYKPVGYFCDVARSGVFAPAKEAIAMRDGHLLRRAGREFAKNLIWMVVAFGALAAILVATTDLPLVGAMAFVGAASAVMSAIVTGEVIGSNAHDETPIGGQQHHYPGWSPGPGGHWRDGSGWDGGGGGGGG